MAVIGIYTKDFPNLGRAVLNTDIIPITELGNVVTYKTTIADLMNSRITGSEGQLSKFGAGNTLTNSILKEIGNAIHLTNAGSSYASFGIVNPGTPGDPGIDNDAYIGSNINNDFLIRVNNTEALRVDTLLRLKIANIQNATTDTDKFLVSDGGVVKFRTGAEMVSDLGIAPHDAVTLGNPNGLSLSGQVLSLGLASSINAGALSAADWSAFNAKQPAGNYVTLDTVQTITAPKTFQISSGSNIPLTILKGGNGEGLIVNKTSGSGNAVTVIGDFEATVIKKTGGTSLDFLRADGSTTFDVMAYSEAYLKFVQYSGTTENYIPRVTAFGSLGAPIIGNSQLQDNGTNVSVGYTTNPGLYKLDVNGTGRFSGNLTVTANNSLNEGVAAGIIRQNGASGNNGLVVDVTNTPNAYIADFRQANSSKVRITGAGNVLIGTTTDALYKLDVNGTGRFSGQLTLSRAVNNNYLSFDHAGAQSWYQKITTANNSSFIISNDYGGGLNILTLAETGAATFSSSVTATSFSNAGLQAGEVFNATKSNAGYFVGYLQNTSATGLGLYIQNGNDSNDALRIGNAAGSANNIQLYGSGKAYFAGNVLIGTTTDAGVKLNVNGAIKTSNPTGGTAQPFKVGSVYSTSSVFAGDVLQVEINGVSYDLMIANSAT